MTERPKVLDHVALVRDQGKWIAGTSGTVVEAFDDDAYVELVGPDGKTLDTLAVPYDGLQVLRPGDHQVAV
jgi:hypothetical protein